MSALSPAERLIDVLERTIDDLAQADSVPVGDLTSEELDTIQTKLLRDLRHQVDYLNSRLAHTRNGRDYDLTVQLIEEHGAVWAMKGYGAHAFDLRDGEPHALCGNAGRGHIVPKRVYDKCKTCERIAIQKSLTPHEINPIRV